MEEECKDRNTDVSVTEVHRLYTWAWESQACQNPSGRGDGEF